MFLVRGYLELLIGKIIERSGKDSAHLKREVRGEENFLKFQEQNIWTKEFVR